MSDDDRSSLDEEEDDEESEMPDWQRDSLERLRRLLGSGRALALPDKFEIHEWDLMRRFSLSVEDPDERTGLFNAIHGTGAFRLFRMTTDRLGLRDRWFEYRAEALREIARDWLENNGIEYVEEGGEG